MQKFNDDVIFRQPQEPEHVKSMTEAVKVIPMENSQKSNVSEFL